MGARALARPPCWPSLLGQEAPACLFTCSWTTVLTAVGSGSSSSRPGLTPLKLRLTTAGLKNMFMNQGQELFPRPRTDDKIFGPMLRFGTPFGDCIAAKGHEVLSGNDGE